MEKGRRGRDLRIGDPERELAMRLLGEHFAVGRLDVGEYDERCRLVATARFRSELEGLFDDLPAPRPERAVPAAQPPASRTRPVPAKVALAVGVAVLAVLLLVVARQAALLLLIPLIAVLWFSWRR
ncbi:DUF1707 domain-containing protein [Saccharopolyspora indica]|uniref:DUF1707 SHOCT-like domain-containing protein n=1 Tax=Saccharopolyspora indica TaxID=1229659 RepID=UPI0022EA50B8|nr:DUF1707 domain-containing protein [Saccharopolyspora indica]MDA3647829.1 DUF1707 domain-containing protein [Saccharopolyspora indica]